MSIRITSINYDPPDSLTTHSVSAPGYSIDVNTGFGEAIVNFQIELDDGWSLTIPVVITPRSDHNETIAEAYKVLKETLELLGKMGDQIQLHLDQK